MKIVVALPDHSYYMWQAVVQAHDARARGIDDIQYLVYQQPGQPPTPHVASLSHLAPVWCIPDPRRAPTYNAAMKTRLVGHWLAAHPQYIDDPIMLIDPDVIITDRLLADLPTPTPHTWIGTDTDSYAGHDYLVSKSALVDLVHLAGAWTDQSIPPLHPWVGAGAQIIFTGVPGAWWLDVADASVRAHTYATTVSPRQPHQGYPLQAWCAEMFMTQLCAMRDGIRIVADPRMDMVWATGAAADWDTSGFFHDAGVQAPDRHHFFKIAYQVSPWRAEIQDPSPDSASARYVGLIRDVAKKSPRLTW